MKKIINDPKRVVSDMLDGLVRSNPSLLKLPNMNCVVKAPHARDRNKVSLVSLGGSGHEPAHAGYIGNRGLDGVACGETFSSPSVNQIVETAKAVATDHGVLFIVKNYTGDVLNTELAQELLAVENIPTEKVIVNDDVAVENSTFTTGRRGIIGTVFVHHVAGVLSTRGLSLPVLKTCAEGAIARIRSAGVSLSPCMIPAVGKPGFQIGDEEMEWFMGIHGEPGIERGGIVTSREIATRILDRIHADLPFESGVHYALIINGCGGTPLMELYILLSDVAKYLEEKGAVIVRILVGNMMTSLEMQGASVSVFKLEDPYYEDVVGAHSCIFPA
jgi:dihydroxyacetone kinase-like protein